MQQTISTPTFICVFCDNFVNQYAGYCKNCNDYKGVMLMSDFIEVYGE
jgi:predicted ATP-dependent serine protease